MSGRVFALVPAGGRSARMGRPKLSLSLGGRTVLEHTVTAFRRAGVEHVLVVVGPHVPELVPLAEAAGAHVCRLAEETADMRATVEQGLRWLEEAFRPGPDDAWLLAPADHPTLSPDVVRQLLQARADHPERSIFVPTWEGRRGHPALIAWKHVAGIRAHPAGQGLNTYLRQCAAEVQEVPASGADVLCDLDTPADYELLRRRWESAKGE
jgi:molybdenum cofactor cytidylyltransferase